MCRGKILRPGLGIRALSLLSLCLIASRGDAGAGGGGGEEKGGGGGGGEEEDPVAISNHFYVMARSYETRGEMLSAMRAFETAHRVNPTDHRFSKARSRIAGSAVGSVVVKDGETEHRMLVWRPKTAQSGKAMDPTAAGGANQQVKSFFESKSIPTHDWKGERCCGFHHRGRGGDVTTVLGLTCLSPLFLHAHNAAQAIILGLSPPPIPTASNVTCGTQCGAWIPPPPSSLPPLPSTRSTHRIVGDDDEDLDVLLKRRKAMLDRMGPHVHRSQLVGDNLAEAAGLFSGGEEVLSLASRVSTARGGEGMGLWWDVRSNRVLPSEIDAETAAAQEWIESMQNGPKECSGRRAVVYKNDRAYWGFAANVQFMTVVLQHALATNRTFIAASPDHWNYAGLDCKMGWECFFHSPSRCTEMDVWEPYTVNFRADYRWDYRGMLYRVDTLDERVIHYSNVDGPWQEVYGHYKTPDEGIEAREWIPRQFRHRGLQWWRAQLTRYLMRPKRFVLEYIGHRMQALGVNQAMSSDLVAMHVRRGDKAYDVYQGSYFGSVGPYIDKAVRLSPGVRKLLVCTDDPEVIQELATAAERHGLETIVDLEERRYNGTHIYAPIGISLAMWPAFPGDDPKVNTTLYALDTIKSIWLLVFAAPAFVGTVTSSMSRLVYQMRVAFGQEELGDEWTVDQDKRHAPGWFADP